MNNYEFITFNHNPGWVGGKEVFTGQSQLEN